MKKKTTPPSPTRAQKRKREAKLFSELTQQHGYAFADTLSKNDRSGMVMSRAGGKMSIKMAFYLKLIVPCDGALGVLIAAQRKERDPATSKSACDRAKANEKTRKAFEKESSTVARKAFRQAARS
jgi:hypothetical protein